MNTLALLLILLSAVAHATWNYFAKRAGGGATFVWLYDLLAVFFYLPIVLIFFFWQHWTLSLLGLLFIVVSGMTHLCYFVLLQRGYRVGDLSLVYPLARGTGPLLASIFAIAFFGERPTPIALAGILLIVVGIFFISGGARIFKAGNHRPGVVYGLIIGVIIAIYTLWDKHAVSSVLVAPLLYEYGVTLVRCVLLAPYALRHRDRLRQDWREHRLEACGVALLSPLAYILVLVALVFTPVSYVAPAREIGVLFGAILGIRLLSEGEARRRLLAAALIVAGIIALAI